MPKDVAKTQRRKPPSSGLMLLLKPYKLLVAILVVLTIVSNAFNLVVPKLISRAIDGYTQGHFVLDTVILQLLVVAVAVFILTYAQNGVHLDGRALAKDFDRAGGEDLPNDRSRGWSKSRRPNC